MLVFIGLGLFDEKDVTVKGFEEAKKCDMVFAEFYTARLIGTSKEKLESLFGKEIKILNRKEVEDGRIILDEAKNKNIAFLTPGDPMTATTHITLRIQAKEMGIKTKIVHGVSIVSAASGLLGLQSYKFGRTTTIPFPEKDYLPESPYEVIRQNKENGLHTLILLDIKPDRLMTANEGMKVLLRIEEKRKEKIVTPDTLMCVVARAGSDDCLISADYVKNLLNKDFGTPMHSLIIPGNLHFMEAESLIKLAGAPESITKESIN
ncbi:MAG: diphthine synthase [Candidatus Thermoplasmatota archaeon]|nr:diphthine synthase [Candidatus Thermoplasmatota archaeon]